MYIYVYTHTTTDIYLQLDIQLDVVCRKVSAKLKRHAAIY